MIRLDAAAGISSTIFRMFEALFAERGLSLDRLRVLVEVRDAGSIAQAAPGDIVRQSQYSRQLRELAEFFGTELTERRGRGLRFKQQGERLVELARAHLRALDDFRTACREASAVFTIGGGDSLLQWLVLPRLGNVLDQCPGTRFVTANLRSGELIRQLLEGRIDFAVVRRNAVIKGLRSAPLGTLTHVAVVPTRLVPKGSGVPDLRRALSELPMASQGDEGQFVGGLRAIAAGLGVPFAPALVCTSFPQLLAAVLTGRYWSVLPTLALPVDSGRHLHRIDADLKPLSRELALAWNPRVIRVRPGAARVLDALRDALATHG
jgi:DNA-binding transcriptional LysR family regulator